MSASHQSSREGYCLFSPLISGAEWEGGEFLGRRPHPRVDEGFLAKRGSCYSEIQRSTNCLQLQIESNVASLVREVSFVDKPVSFLGNKGDINCCHFRDAVGSFSLQSASFF